MIVYNKAKNESEANSPVQSPHGQIEQNLQQHQQQQVQLVYFVQQPNMAVNSRVALSTMRPASMFTHGVPLPLNSKQNRHPIVSTVNTVSTSTATQQATQAGIQIIYN